jgi:carbon monoxide dehydrogenase subunit G
MLLNITENLELAATQPEVWRLLRDTQRLATLVPGVESVSRIEAAELEAYEAKVTEKVGPFKVTMKLEVTIIAAVELSELKVSVNGGDTTKLSRATGPIRVELSACENGTSMRLEIAIEVLGKLATLGASVIRRRVNELFAEFGRRVVAEFQAAKQFQAVKP